jgi:hypothetical protein
LEPIPLSENSIRLQEIIKHLELLIINQFSLKDAGIEKKIENSVAKRGKK